MTPRTAQGRATVPLLYWLLVVCGLAGLTATRLDAPGDLVPLWIGTVAGVALGQQIAWLRVRIWFLAVIGVTACWLAPVFFFVVYTANGTYGSPFETFVIAFLPAGLCAYLSLSERAGLVAFWYPAVLWMLVILDGATDARVAIPVAVALAGLFVAFLRARETRRAAIWQAHGTARLATSPSQIVLRASPLRGASQMAWTGLVGASTLVLAAWVAPHLWQSERDKHASPAARTEALGSSDRASPPCCQDLAPDDARARVREYFPLRHGHDEESRARACVACSSGSSDSQTASITLDGPGATNPSSGLSSSLASGPGVGSPPVATIAPSAAPPTVTASSPGEVPAPPVARVPLATSSVAPAPRSPSSAVGTVTVTLRPSAPPVDVGSPWRSALALVLGGLALHLGLRALRRRLTLRHLARPFWEETLGQRISNHWQRVLIGLRDAGIHQAPDEQPHALARRVDIEGVETCATILERARHGVRVDDADLATMSASADAAFRAARQRAGTAGRAVAWLRAPL